MAGIGPILSCDAEELPWTALEDSLTDAIFPSCLREQPLRFAHWLFAVPYSHPLPPNSQALYRQAQVLYRRIQAVYHYGPSFLLKSSPSFLHLS